MRRGMKSAKNRGWRPFPLGWSGHISRKIDQERVPVLEDVLFDWRIKDHWNNKKAKRKNDFISSYSSFL